MNDEISRDRSPRSPAITLEKAIELVGKFHTECRRNAVAPETGAKAMGFNTVHGGVLTTFAGLREYGLIDRPNGKIALTPLSVRILHPISDAQRIEAIREASLLPRIFQTLINDFGDCSQSVLESHLVQAGFTPERARVVARVFIANKAFAKLEAAGNVDVSENESPDETSTSGQENAPSFHPVAVGGSDLRASRQSFMLTDPMPQLGQSSAPEGHKLLAQYTIPLGSNQATLVFTGDRLTADDFDALIDFVGFSKRQFERAQKSAPQIENVSASRETMSDFETYHSKRLLSE